MTDYPDFWAQVREIAPRKWYVYVYEGNVLLQVRRRFSERGAYRLANRIEKKGTHL